MIKIGAAWKPFLLLLEGSERKKACEALGFLANEVLAKVERFPQAA